MLQSINEKEFTLIRDYITGISGIVISPEKAYLIETRLTKLMLDYGAETFHEFHKKVLINSGIDVAQKVIDAITINETFWFRDASLWKCFEQEVLPGLIKEITSGRKEKVRIWSAAVSTGQEAYSIAMCIDNYLVQKKIKDVKLSDFEIVATDISNRVLGIAGLGRYDKISMTRGISGYYKARYFESNGSVWDIDPEIKSAVRFRRLDLRSNYKVIGEFDVIFCRYVLIYFPNDLKKRIASKMHKALNEGGVLFTGNYVVYDLFRDNYNVKTFENITYYSKIIDKEKENGY